MKQRFSEYRHFGAACLAAALITVFLGAGVLRVTFISDDVALTAWGRDAVGRGFWKPWLGDHMTGEAGSPPYYRPLTLVSHGFDMLVWGLRPAGHRLTNLLLHFLNTLLVYALARGIPARRPPAWALCATALFALHPVHETAVWWISCRMELLCAFFYLACVVLYQRFLATRRGLPLALSVFAGLLALTAKEMAYTLPLVCFGLGLLAGEDPPMRRARRAAVYALPVAVVACGFLALRLTRMPLENTLYALRATPGHLLMVARLTARYLMFPFHISARALVTGHPMGIAAAMAALACLLRPLWRRVASPGFLIGAVWIAVTCLPLVRTMSPWTLYIPSAGFCLAVAALFEPERSRRGACAALLLAALLAAYAAQLQTRKAVWRETDRVIRAVVDDYREIVARGELDPVILCAPGAVDDVPALLHYFDLRMRLETGVAETRPLVLTFVRTPPDPARRAIAVESAGDRSWTLRPDDEAVTFLFPDRGYEFQEYPAGVSLEQDWGAVAFHGANTPRAITTIALRVAPEPFEALRNRPWYHFDGLRLVPLSNPAG